MGRQHVISVILSPSGTVKRSVGVGEVKEEEEEEQNHLLIFSLFCATTAPSRNVAATKNFILKAYMMDSIWNQEQKNLIIER